MKRLEISKAFGKTLHAMVQLSLWATTSELTLQSLHPGNKKPQREARTSQLENAHTQQWRSSTAKNN